MNTVKILINSTLKVESDASILIRDIRNPPLNAVTSYTKYEIFLVSGTDGELKGYTPSLASLNFTSKPANIDVKAIKPGNNELY